MTPTHVPRNRDKRSQIVADSYTGFGVVVLALQGLRATHEPGNCQLSRLY